MSVLVGHSDAPPTSSGGAASVFPGFGEGAPLELPSTIDPAHLVRRLLDGTHEAFADTLARVGNCAHPIRLTGSSVTVDPATGEVLSVFESASQPMGELYVPCGNRRATVCPSCSRIYARDTFELIRAGITGGKTVPETVSGAPLLFVTLTAPSFGHVHRRATDKHGNPAPCRPRRRDTVKRCPHGVRLACHRTHTDTDPMVGAPLCPDCYDWTGAVVWNFHAPELWRRTTIAIRRELAKRLGVSASRLNEYARFQFVKVAEYQERGLIHFHAVARLDGPDGPGTTSGLDTATFARIVRDVVPTVEVTAPPTHENDTARLLGWGVQLDVKPIICGARDLAGDENLSPEKVAGYLAKYATKDAGDLRTTGDRPHLQRLVSECRRLADLAHERALIRADNDNTTTVVPLDPRTGLDHYALMRKWAHMLGFRGHFATKSRRYSLTLGRLRAARAKFRRLLEHAHHTSTPLDTRDLETRLLTDDHDDETTLVITSWQYIATGWPRTADAELAAAAEARAREYARWKARQHS